MKRLLLFLFLICFVKSFSQPQTGDSSDHQIEQQFRNWIYAGEAASADTNIIPYVLVKAETKYIDAFKRQFYGAIKRQIAKEWFVIKSRELNNLYRSGLIVKAVPANLEWKLSPALLQNQSKLSDKDYTFLIEASDTTAFRKLVSQNPSKAISVSAQPGYNLFRVRTTIAFIKQIFLPSATVNAVDLRITAPKEETVINDYDNSTNAINLFFAKYPAITADGLTVSIKENIFDKADIDFKNRYKETGLGNTSATSHATTMATLAAGGGNSFFTGKGVAPAALLASSDFINLLPDGNSYQQYSISVQNHSYGVGIENFYGSDAAAYDASMVSNPYLLHVFSAGNAGTSADTAINSPYPDITGFANITGSFKMAKNILTVGSIDSFYTVPALSSKGPAHDGRIKPDLVAYGNDGSSGAAAITSGTVLAVQSAYAQGHSGALPANALTKTIIINSADDIYKKGPDYTSGYGNVNTFRAVQGILSGNYFSGSVAGGETKNFSITLPANAKNLKVTLVWTDPAAQANAFTALVNDLDLQLQRQSNTWQPWVLNSAASADSLNQPAKRKRDSLNVAEQITIDNPAAGDYIIHVNGYSIPQGPQDFYIAYRWDVADSFYFISPAAKDHFTSGGNSIFRWKSTYANNTTGQLEYSIDKGVSWQLIKSAVNLDAGYYKWTTPDTFTTALARMTISGDIYISDTFNFSRQLFPEVGFNCNDSVLIYWSKIPGVNQYKLYALGDTYLQPLTATADTSIVITNAASPYIAVATVLQDDNTGVNSYTFNYNTQGVGCFISSFLADLTTNKTALLQLSLGTVFNVSTIQFQQLTISGWQTIQTIEPVTNTENSYDANTLNAGINSFRAVVTLGNGNIITSDEIAVYFTGNNKFAVLPNPVQQGQNLTILSDNFFTNTVAVYDITGRKVLQQNMSSNRSDINTGRLAKGVYIVIIYSEGSRAFTGKIVVQ